MFGRERSRMHVGAGLFVPPIFLQLPLNWQFHSLEIRWSSFSVQSNNRGSPDFSAKKLRKVPYRISKSWSSKKPDSGKAIYMHQVNLPLHSVSVSCLLEKVEAYESGWACGSSKGCGSSSNWRLQTPSAGPKRTYAFQKVRFIIPNTTSRERRTV